MPPQNKNVGVLLFMASVGLILVAIVFTAVIDRTNSNKPGDARARASKTGSMEFIGTVARYDQTNNTLVVDSLQFTDSDGKSLGTWNITPAFRFNPSQFSPATKIRITANPVTFQINSQTLTATEIEKQ